MWKLLLKMFKRFEKVNNSARTYVEKINFHIGESFRGITEPHFCESSPVLGHYKQLSHAFSIQRKHNAIPGIILMPINYEKKHQGKTAQFFPNKKIHKTNVRSSAIKWNIDQRAIEKVRERWVLTTIMLRRTQTVVPVTLHYYRTRIVINFRNLRTIASQVRHDKHDNLFDKPYTDSRGGAVLHSC